MSQNDVLRATALSDAATFAIQLIERAVLTDQMIERDAAAEIRIITDLFRRCSLPVTRSSSVGSGKDIFLSDRQKSRTAEVRSMLSHGESPFAKTAKTEGYTANPDTESKWVPHPEGGADPVSKSKVRERSKTEIKDLERKWRDGVAEGGHGTGKFLTGDYPKSPFKGEIVDQSSPLQPKCSFCGDPVDLHRATHGTSQLRFTRVDEEIILPDNTIAHKEKMVASTDKLIACPNCVNQIEPTVRWWCPNCLSFKSDGQKKNTSTCRVCGVKCESEVEKNNIKFYSSED